MSVLQRFKRLVSDTHNTTAGVKQDYLFDVVDFIYRTMKDEGMTQREFAQNVGMEESQLSRILNTEVNLTAVTIARFVQKAATGMSGTGQG